MMKIKWALNELRAHIHEPIKLEGSLDQLTDNLLKRSNDILDISSIHIDGWLIVDSKDEFTVDAELSLKLILPSTRSLEPVDVAYNVRLSETYLSPNFIPEEDIDYAEEVFIQLEKDILNLQKPIEDSILVSLPTKVLTQQERELDEFPQGDNWQVVSEDDRTHLSLSSEEDSPFSALKELFPNEDSRED